MINDEYLNVCLQDGRIPLNDSVRHGNVETAKSFIVAGVDINMKDKTGATPLDIEISSRTTHDLIEHHTAALAIASEDPFALNSPALVHCATLSSSADAFLEPELVLRAFQLDPFFSWAPLAAREEVFKWAKNIFVAQLAATARPFLDLLEDCAGDVLEFFDMSIPHDFSLLIATHCSSPEAIAWVRSVLEAAVVVSSHYCKC